VKFGITALALNEGDVAQLERAMRCISSVQSIFRLESLDVQYDAKGKMLPWPYDDIRPNECQNLIAISSLPFEDNWFSHSTRGLSIISTDSWSELFAPPGLASFLMMEIALAIYTPIADSKDGDLGPHSSAIGCLFNFCVNEPDIAWKMRCGSLCAEHEGRFRQHGGSRRQLEAIQRILEATRLTAFGRLAFDDLPTRTPKAKVFIGSSSEASTIAFALQQCIESQCPESECSGVFKPGKNFLTSLVSTAMDSDFAILIAGRDDLMVWRGEDVAIPRDNVTFELGLFIGVLGTERKYIFCPENAPKLPSDLDGITDIRFRDREDKNFQATLRPGATQIVQEIRDLGPRDRWSRDLSL
jgi:predicted nucleotide-binding protein